MTEREERRHRRMMSLGVQRPVALIVEGKRTEGEVRFQRWELPARLGRAAKSCALLWSLAALSLLIPVAHFILVPGFLIAGPVAGLRRLWQQSGVLGGEGKCPACGGQLIIEAHADEWPLFEICVLCRA